MSNPSKKFDYAAARAAIDARRIMQVIEKRHLRRRENIRRDLPSARHLMRVARHQYRGLLVMAALEANLAARKNKSDYAWIRLLNQRDSYARRENLVQSIIGGSKRAKLFDIKLHLSSAADTDPFDDAVPTLPLREIAAPYYWQPRIRPYTAPYVTDGSLPIGGLRVEYSGERFTPVSIHDYMFDLWSDRRLFDPIDAFVFMRCTGGEEAADGVDGAINRAVRGKKHPRSAKAQDRENQRKQTRAREAEAELAKKRNASRKSKAKLARALLRDDITESDTYSQLSQADIDSIVADIETIDKPSPFFDESNIASSSAPSAPATGFVTPYDYAHASSSQTAVPATSSPKKKEGKAQNKKASYTAYVDYDDPTLPNPKEVQQEAWRDRYLRGETLYWMDGSLTENLAENLYFDSSSIDLRAASEFSISDSFQSTSASSVYFEELPVDERRISLDDFHPASLHSSFSHSLYFSNDDIPVHSTATSGDSWKTADIFFSEADLPSQDHHSAPHTMTSSNSSIYFDCNSFATNNTPLTSSQSFTVEEPKSDPYFSQLDSTTQSSLTMTYVPYSFDYNTPQTVEETQLTSAMFDARCASPTATHDQFDTSIYGNPSAGIAFIQ